MIDLIAAHQISDIFRKYIIFSNATEHQQKLIIC